jgi:hypothetical protein
MASTINGNVGGSAASGAQVQCLNIRTNAVVYGAGDGSGNYSIPNLAAGIYQIRAFLASNVYYHPKQIAVDGVTTYADVNLAPTALNASNVVPETGNF